MSENALLDAKPAVASPHVAVVRFTDTAVAFDAATRELRELNPTAALVWELLDGRTIDAVCDDLARSFTVDRAVLEADVVGLVESFRSLGMLCPVDTTRATDPSVKKAPVERGSGRRNAAWRARLARCVEARVTADGALYGAAELVFRVRTDDPMMAEELRRVLRPLRLDPGVAQPTKGQATAVPSTAVPPTVRPKSYTVLRRARGWTLHFENTPLGRRNDPDLAVGTLLWHLNQQIVAHRGSAVALHAGSVAGVSGSAIFPGVSNAGKSTLAAVLVEAGWGYVSDEVAMIHPATRCVAPVPKAFAFDPGSFAMFPDARPQVAEELTYGLARKWHVDPTHFGAIGTPQPVRVVIGPEFVPGAAPSLMALEPRETLDLLVASAFDLDLDGFLCLADVAKNVPGYRLRSGDARATVDLLRPLLPPR